MEVSACVNRVMWDVGYVGVLTGVNKGRLEHTSNVCSRKGSLRGNHIVCQEVFLWGT